MVRGWGNHEAVISSACASLIIRSTALFTVCTMPVGWWSPARYRYCTLRVRVHFSFLKAPEGALSFPLGTEWDSVGV